MEAHAQMNAGDDEPMVYDLNDIADAGVAKVISVGADWVRVPDELGGGKVYIKARVRSECPKCDTLCVAYLLLNGLIVYNCGKCKQFYWCRSS